MVDSRSCSLWLRGPETPCCKSRDEADLFGEPVSISRVAEPVLVEGYFIRPGEPRKPWCGCGDDGNNFAVAWWELGELVVEAVADNDYAA
jgi:hypothetical protein